MFRLLVIFRAVVVLFLDCAQYSKIETSDVMLLAKKLGTTPKIDDHCTT
jgi:hypothetical protein